MKIKEIPYDQFTPITVYRTLASKGCCILESSPGKDRYSFIGIDPIDKIEGQGDYEAVLREFQKKYASDQSLLFMGGPIGYIGYDQSYFFQVYQSGCLFDHQLGKAYLATLGDQKELERLYAKLNTSQTLGEIAFEIKDIEVDRSDEEYGQMIERAKEYMRKGDVYQVVLSRTFRAKFEGSPFQFYRALRRISSAPFLFFFDLDPLFIVGASPEKIISVQDGFIESMPIAGSCPKGGSVEELLKDIKENAEHVMLVDLARNDIGKVSIPGSVKLGEYKTVHEFSHITHIVSKVVGTLDPQFDAIDAFKASFPAGTLTGAPKKRAMEIIQEIEGDNRGLYGGAIVALDAKGNLTSCIAIRTALIQNGEMTVRAGAGMVLDSDPQKEAEESRSKANTILEVASAILRPPKKFEKCQGGALNLSQAQPAPKQINLKSLSIEAGLEFSGCPTQAGSNFLSGSSILIIDNYDSFTYNLFQGFAEIDPDVKVVKNDAITIEEIEAMRPSGIVLSPGPGRPEDAGICLEVIRHFQGKIPILGVCLGHQAIGLAFGASVTRAPHILHGKECLVFHSRKDLFSKMPLPFKAGRYHSLLVENLPEDLIVEAESPEGAIMGLRHKTLPIYGVQFHPESVLTPEGSQILKNFLKVCHARAD